VILVAVGSALATFVVSVMGDEQDQRLKNGTFGAVAGTSIGGLAGLMTKQADLLVVGFFGSVVGALNGMGSIPSIGLDCEHKDNMAQNS
jgi:hypothetical protein